ncbi:roadblock/LC7 domain-containing protein [Geobacter pickeringii]|uniref:GTPase n=1 Tax=Geobacter pickeringii TaxID=345632 RepID=A0A0B5B8N9_9BACT|nr:GTPase [Geobacter pickeringii]AJE02907.1 GTPase [Geobacter pickeringii]
MPFREALKGIVESVEGGLGAVIMGYDGIAIEQYHRDDTGMDLNLMAVEYATVIKEVKRTVEVLDTGEMEEVSVNTGQTRIIVRAINDDLFLLLTLHHDGNYGKGRYLLRRAAPEFRVTLS